MNKNTPLGKPQAFRTSAGEAANRRFYFKQRSEVDKHKWASAPFCILLIYRRE
jgi:hypothetical protein